MYTDPEGHIAFFVITMLIGAVVGAAAGVGIGYLAGYEGTDLIAWGVGGAVIGGVIGAVTGTQISYTATGSLTSSFSQIKAGFAAAKLNPGQCFVAGTLVLTEDGLIPIEEVEDGMLVWASDPETGETALKPVVQLFRNETTELVHVTVNGEEIVCTNEHPFYSPVKGWTEACRLRAGDILVLVNGEYVIVEQVQHEILEAPVATYNFEVQDFHTYYVSEQSILVHNKCSGSYEIIFESGKNYVGKGSEARMKISARIHSTLNNDPVVSQVWQYAPDTKTAFVDEYFKMAVRGVNNPNTYNKIWSPGRKIFMDFIARL